jgi:hypothetical protein
VQRTRQRAGERPASRAGGSERSRVPPERRLAALLILAAAALAAVACSSVVSESDDPWTASYVGDAERVWAAIHRALDALGYEVEEEDRGEGKIRAAQVAERSYQSVVLHIVEIQKAELVRVVVRPSAGATGTPDDHRRRDEAVREFLTALDEQLGRRPAR